MDYREKLLEYIEGTDGVLLTGEVEKEGIPRQYLRFLAVEGVIEHIAHGVYITPKTKMDELFFISIRSECIIFSGETALYMNGLIDHMPSIQCVTVPRTYATNRLRDSGIKVVTSKEELHELGMITMNTKYGREVRVYNMERAILDMVRVRRQMKDGEAYQILRKYFRKRNANKERLYEYAKTMNMEHVLAQAMKEAKIDK